MYSQEGHIKRVFLELDMKGFTYSHACGGWCESIYHEIQSSWEAVRGPGKEDSTKFFLVSSPAPWTTHTPTPSSWLFSFRYTHSLTGTSGAGLLLLMPSHPHPCIWEHKTHSNHKTMYSSFLSPINFLYLKKY